MRSKYRVIHKFSYTWNELFMVNWFISIFFCETTKWKTVLFPQCQKILIKLSKHGLSYSLKHNLRSISKITFYANWRVSPIDIEIWELFKQKLLFVIQISIILAWIRSDGWKIFSFYQDNPDLNKKIQFLWKILQVLYQYG